MPSARRAHSVTGTWRASDVLPHWSRALSTLAVGACLVLTTAACAPVRAAVPLSIAPTRKTKVVTTTAREGDITPVLSLDATVTAPIKYQVTSPVQGVLKIDPRGGMTVTESTGTAIAITPDTRSQDVTPLVPSGSAVLAAEPVATATFGGVALLAPLKPADLLRFLASPASERAEINGSGGPFDCSLLDGRPSVADDGSSFVACIIPAGVTALAGLTGVVAVRFPTAKHVVVLPIAAVAGELTSGEVFKRVGKRFVLTHVGLGVSDGDRIVITSGLSVGDVVEIPRPSLLDE